MWIKFNQILSYLYFAIANVNGEFNMLSSENLNDKYTAASSYRIICESIFQSASKLQKPYLEYIKLTTTAFEQLPTNLPSLNLRNVVDDREDLSCFDENFGLSMVLFKAESYKLYFTLGSFLGLIVIIIMYWYTKKKTIVMWFKRKLCIDLIFYTGLVEDTLLRSDAFLALSHKDLELLEEYVEKLEKGPCKYQLCFYQRDWLIGESIPDCILKSIEYSKRTIILMTNNFVNSSWGLFEFRSAIRATSLDKDKRLIVILYQEVDIDKLDSELKRYMKYNTYLRRDDPLFWRKLMFEMAHKQVQCDQPTCGKCHVM